MESLDKLCEKHSLTTLIKNEILEVYKDAVFKVFLERCNDNKPTVPKCKGIKANGENCTVNAKENGYCGRHTKKESKRGSKKESKKAIKPCNANNEDCADSETVRPNGSNFYYCKNHADKWIDYELESESESEQNN